MASQENNRKRARRNKLVEAKPEVAASQELPAVDAQPELQHADAQTVRIATEEVTTLQPDALEGGEEEKALRGVTDILATADEAPFVPMFASDEAPTIKLEETTDLEEDATDKAAVTFEKNEEKAVAEVEPEVTVCIEEEAVNMLLTDVMIAGAAGSMLDADQLSEYRYLVTKLFHMENLPDEAEFNEGLFKAIVEQLHREVPGLVDALVAKAANGEYAEVLSFKNISPADEPEEEPELEPEESEEDRKARLNAEALARTRALPWALIDTYLEKMAMRAPKTEQLRRLQHQTLANQIINLTYTEKEDAVAIHSIRKLIDIIRKNRGRGKVFDDRYYMHGANELTAVGFTKERMAEYGKLLHVLVEAADHGNKLKLDWDALQQWCLKGRGEIIIMRIRRALNIND